MNENGAHWPEHLQNIWDHRGGNLALRRQRGNFDRPYIAVLGGSEAFGKLVKTPFPGILSDWIGMPVANLGVMYAGVSLFSRERWLLDVASRAELTVLQVMSTQNMSNRLYCVHPRRNDRFLTASSALRVIFPEVDFAEVNFTGHLMETLERTCPERFHIVVEELRWAWVQRMRRVLSYIESDVLLLWMSERSPETPADRSDSPEPMFVTRGMLNEISDLTIGITEVILAQPTTPSKSVPFACGPGDAPLHSAVAEALAGRVADILDLNMKDPGLSAGVRRPVTVPEAQSFSMSSGTAVKRSATRP